MLLKIGDLGDSNENNLHIIKSVKIVNTYKYFHLLNDALFTPRKMCQHYLPNLQTNQPIIRNQKTQT